LAALAIAEFGADAVTAEADRYASAGGALGVRVARTPKGSCLAALGGRSVGFGVGIVLDVWRVEARIRGRVGTKILGSWVFIGGVERRYTPCV
jgi:hypothetical protein